MKLFNIFILTFVALFGKSIADDNILPAGCLTAFTSAALQAHNGFRLKHNTPSLSLNSPNLTESANKFAQYLAANNVFNHSQTQNYGENLYAEYTSEVLTKDYCASKKIFPI